MRAQSFDDIRNSAIPPAIGNTWLQVKVGSVWFKFVASRDRYRVRYGYLVDGYICSDHEARERYSRATATA